MNTKLLTPLLMLAFASAAAGQTIYTVEKDAWGNLHVLQVPAIQAQPPVFAVPSISARKMIQRISLIRSLRIARRQTTAQATSSAFYLLP